MALAARGCRWSRLDAGLPSCTRTRAEKWRLLIALRSTELSITAKKSALRGEPLARVFLGWSPEQGTGNRIDARQRLKLAPAQDSNVRALGLVASSIPLGVTSDPVAK